MLKKIINGFDGKKAHGNDKMPMKLLQECANIAKLINNYFSKRIFPADLQFAEVSSLFKRNDALNKSNYEPLRVLIVLSKTYGKAVSIQVTDHFIFSFTVSFS